MKKSESSVHVILVKGRRHPYSPSHLLAVVRSLRAEKKISDAHLRAVSVESAKIKQRVKVLSKQLAEAKASLQQELERAEVMIKRCQRISLIKLQC